MCVNVICWFTQLLGGQETSCGLIVVVGAIDLSASVHLFSFCPILSPIHLNLCLLSSFFSSLKTVSRVRTAFAPCSLQCVCYQANARLGKYLCLSGKCAPVQCWVSESASFYKDATHAILKWTPNCKCCHCVFLSVIPLFTYSVLVTSPHNGWDQWCQLWYLKMS